MIGLQIIYNASKCAGCMTCVLRCSFRHEHIFNLAASCIQINRLTHQANEFDMTITDECDSCGICVRYCPYGALTRQEIREKA